MGRRARQRHGPRFFGSAAFAAVHLVFLARACVGRPRSVGGGRRLVLWHFPVLSWLERLAVFAWRFLLVSLSAPKLGLQPQAYRASVHSEERELTAGSGARRASVHSSGVLRPVAEAAVDLGWQNDRSMDPHPPRLGPPRSSSPRRSFPTPLEPSRLPPIRPPYLGHRNQSGATSATEGSGSSGLAQPSVQRPFLWQLNAAGVRRRSLSVPTLAGFGSWGMRSAAGFGLPRVRPASASRGSWSSFDRIAVPSACGKGAVQQGAGPSP